MMLLVEVPRVKKITTSIIIFFSKKTSVVRTRSFLIFSIVSSFE